MYMYRHIVLVTVCIIIYYNNTLYTFTIVLHTM